MEGNYSNRVKDVLQLSREECIRLAQDYIGAEHLLLGLIREGEGIAVKILHNLGADLYKIKKAIEDVVRKSGSTLTIGNIPFTKQTEKILKICYLEAKLFRSDVIGTEHLLLSLLRDEDNIAAHILNQFSISYEAVRNELDNIIVGKSSFSGAIKTKLQPLVIKEFQSAVQTRFQRKLHVMMNVAYEFASLSTCARKQVGSIITTSNLSKVVSVGYNGGYSGDENRCESNREGFCGCLHAEQNALLKFNPDSGTNFMMFCTLSICKTCAKNLINVGNISSIIYDEEYRLRDGIELIKNHGRIKIYQLSELLKIKNLERLPNDDNKCCKC